MTNKIQKNDFIEIEFTAKIKDTGEIFDTNIKENAEKAELNIKDPRPFILSVGNNMIIKGLDNSLEGKEIGKEYTEEIPAKEAFGTRNPKLTRMIPLKAFHQQKINPQRGMQLSLDGKIAKVLSVSGGRVLVDFNNPLAGKDVIYEFKINKKIEDNTEKINALQDFFFRNKFEFKISEDKKTITFKVPEPAQQYIKMMAKPFKEILELDVKTEPLKPEKEKNNKDIKKEDKKSEKPSDK